ncbi:hypothetical protein A5660_15620 [Mycobacterium alsense]|uniref:hypothetical protein n=1 Tax=Mycobacterium alsense TaxID=324058 RepID=UPI0007FCCF58|nr:hypothetical protein [Mycobacterium alsense]OBJ05618.1 hypothetical protein A5660_15620 [Mycobacterium alsense]
MAFVGRTDVKDPGAQQDQWERLARRRERLYAEDEQFRITRPDDDIAAAARAPGLRIAEVMATVLRGYADRPALGQREPMPAVPGSPVPGERFRSAIQAAGRAIPHLSKELIHKYLADLERLGVLSGTEGR